MIDSNLLNQGRRGSRDCNHNIIKIDEITLPKNTSRTDPHSWKCSECNWISYSNPWLLLWYHFCRADWRWEYGRGERLHLRNVTVGHSGIILKQKMYTVRTDENRSAESWRRWIPDHDKRHNHRRYSTSSLVQMDKEQAVQYHQHSTNNQQTNYPSDNQHHTQPVQTTSHPNTAQKEKERECFLDELHWKPQMRQKNTTPNEQDTHTKTTKT